MMTAEIRDPRGDTGTGVEITAIGNRRHRTSRDLVADMVEVETGKTAEAAVSEGGMVQTQTPPPIRAENSGRWTYQSRRR